MVKQSANKNMVMCPDPWLMFCLWWSWSSLTSQQRLQDFSWNWKTHQTSNNLCKTAVLKCSLRCLVQPPGKTIKGYKPRACYFSRTFCIMPKICGDTICFKTNGILFVCLFVCLLAVCSTLTPSWMFSWPMTLQCDSGFETYAPDTIGNDLIQEFCIIWLIVGSNTTN